MDKHYDKNNKEVVPQTKAAAAAWNALTEAEKAVCQKSFPDV